MRPICEGRVGARLRRTTAKTHNKNSEYVEEDDAPEHTTNGLRHVASRICRFSGGQGDDLGAEVGECSLHKDRPEAEELSKRPRDVVELLERPGGAFPVAEADGLLARHSSRRDDDAK